MPAGVTGNVVSFVVRKIFLRLARYRGKFGIILNISACTVQNTRVRRHIR